jgi:MFS transporter, FSR family, fosmidomycin resistance protein
MTQAIDLPLRAMPTEETRLVSMVCFAHFASHYYITLLAPLFLFVRDGYGVTNTQLAYAYTAFSLPSILLQTPAGFLVDRVSARMMLIVGLLGGALAFALAALINSFWVFVAMFAVAGLANTVYHPADYALLSRHVPAERAGRAFSLHTFAGMFGNAAAPLTLLPLQSVVGWRGAFLGAAALGFVAAAVVALVAEPAQATAVKAKPRGQSQTDQSKRGWQLLLSAPILLNLFFFVLLSISGGGFSNFLVAALGALHGTTPGVGNTALTGLLLFSAGGVLAGGWLSGRTSHHGMVATIGLTVMAVMAALVALINFPAALLIIVLSVTGFASGIVMPSRDMIVRNVTPPGAYGRVFGFVSTGFNIGGIVSPLIFGQLLDRGYAGAIFFCVAGCALASISTVAVSSSRKAPAG